MSASPGPIRSLLDLGGRAAVVTGGSTGMGRAIAAALAEFGADVAFQYSAKADAAVGEADAAAAAVQELGAFGHRAVALEGDLAEAGAPAWLASEAVGRLGRVDIVVLCAAIHERVQWDRMPPEQFDREVAVNLRSTIELLSRLVPPMAARGWGRVLGIGSTTQMSPRHDLSLYCALKSGQENLMRNLAKIHAREGVTFNTLAPGLVVTPRNKHRRVDAADWNRIVAAENPMGRAGRPEEIAALAVVLCAPASSYITGANIWADGGAHIPMQP